MTAQIVLIGLLLGASLGWISSFSTRFIVQKLIKCGNNSRFIYMLMFKIGFYFFVLTLTAFISVKLLIYTSVGLVIFIVGNGLFRFKAGL